jgi:uncharacterized protein (TIGR00251 family)
LSGIPDGTALAVFVQPRAAHDAIVGRHGDRLKIKVAAPPVDDRANRAVETLLADFLGIPKRAVSVVAGHAQRSKRVEIRGLPPARVASALVAVLSSRAHGTGQEALQGQDDQEEDDG